MRDEKQWRKAVVEFQALRGNVPGYVSEAFVRDYHEILDRMSVASGEDFDLFRVPQSELKPRVIGVRVAGRRSPGKTYYSDGATSAIAICLSGRLMGLRHTCRMLSRCGNRNRLTIQWTIGP